MSDQANRCQTGFPTQRISAASWERVDAVCLEFEREWQRGVAPNLEDYLRGIDEDLRAVLFTELLYLDIDYRRRLGERPQRTDYETRFPAETGIIDSALGETGLDGGSVNSGIANDGEVPERLAWDELTLTNRYRLETHHATGGLGVIYFGRDEQLGRNVAIKFCRRRANGFAEHRRLEREAAITGRLTHPGIVPVYAVGVSPAGDPYYVMQQVEGETFQCAIAEFHSASRSEGPARFEGVAFRVLLQHFITVCNTVAYAHEQSVIHRDIKPANIMLGRFGETFLLDWGLAKSLGECADADRASSDFGSTRRFNDCETVSGQLLGTPAFASPEQLAGEVDRHNTCSDIYSLGATLYYLLVGKGARQKSVVGVPPASMVRAVPPPRELHSAIPIALDAICMKAMALDPAARYPTAKALAADLDGFLADKPLAIAPEPWAFRVRRWLRCHPRTSGAIAAALGVAILSLGTGSVLLREKNRQLRESIIDLDLARHSLVATQSQARSALRSLTDNAIERWLAARGELSGEDEAFVQSILAHYERFAETRVDRAEAWETKIEGMFRVGQLQQVLGRNDQAASAWRNLLTACAASPEPLSPAAQRRRTKTQANLGVLLSEMGDREQGTPMIQSAADQARLRLERAPASAEALFDFAAILDQLGNVKIQSGEHDAAVHCFRESLRNLAKFAESSPTEVIPVNVHRAATSHNLGLALLMSQQPDAAETELAESLRWYTALGTEQSRVQNRINRSRVYSTLATAQVDIKKATEASRHYDQAIALATELIADYPGLAEPLAIRAGAHHGLARIALHRGQFDAGNDQARKAESDIREALRVSPSDRSQQRVACRIDLTLHDLLSRGGDGTEASAALARALDIAEQLVAADGQFLHRKLLIDALIATGQQHLQQNRLDECAAAGSRALQLVLDTPDSVARGRLRKDLVGCHQLCGWSLMFAGKADQAIEHWKSILALTADAPIVVAGVEDMATSALAYHAYCQATLDPFEAIAEIRALEVRTDLSGVHMYNLACAAGQAGQRLDVADEAQAANSLALDLLERSIKAGYFRTIDGQRTLTQNPSFKALADQVEFQRLVSMVGPKKSSDQ